MKKLQVPEPAHPSRRKTQLPWQAPKPEHEDPACARRIRAILDSAAYQPATEDVDFLHSEDARAVRLQLDYLKPQRLMMRHGIENTIVVFGSTRIVEPAAARKKVEDLRSRLALKPDDEQLKADLAIAERIVEKSRYYETAREFSRLVARSCEENSNEARSSAGPVDPPLVIMTGGGPGIMEAANRGSDDIGAKTIGLNISLPHEQYPNPYLTPELCFQFHYFAMRKLHFMLRARALVAFPGGYGTFDELFETLTLIQTRKIRPLPVVLVGRQFWQRAFDIDFMVAEGVIDAEDRDLFWYAETAEEIWESLNIWYRRAGESLVAGTGTVS